MILLPLWVYIQESSMLPFYRKGQGIKSLIWIWVCPCHGILLNYENEQSTDKFNNRNKCHLQNTEERLGRKNICKLNGTLSIKSKNRQNIYNFTCYNCCYCFEGRGSCSHQQKNGYKGDFIGSANILFLPIDACRMGVFAVRKCVNYTIMYYSGFRL